MAYSGDKNQMLNAKTLINQVKINDFGRNCNKTFTFIRQVPCYNGIK